MYSYGETWGRLEREDETWSRKEEGVKEHEEGQGTLRAIFSGQMGIYNHRIFAKHTHLRKKSKWKHGAKNGFHLRELAAGQRSPLGTPKLLSCSPQTECKTLLLKTTHMYLAKNKEVELVPSRLLTIVHDTGRHSAYN